MCVKIVIQGNQYEGSEERSKDYSDLRPRRETEKWQKGRKKKGRRRKGRETG